MTRSYPIGSCQRAFMRPLLKEDGAYDRSAIMRDAAREYKKSKSLGHNWSWSHCLRFSWAKAKKQREQSRDYIEAVQAFRSAPRSIRNRDVLWVASHV